MMENGSYLASLAALLIDIGVDVSVHHDEENQENELVVGDDYFFAFDYSGDELLHYGQIVDDDLIQPGESEAA